MKIFIALILQEILFLSICTEIPIEETTNTTTNNSKIPNKNPQKADNSSQRRRKLTPITSPASPCKYLAALCIFELEDAYCSSTTNRHVRLGGEVPKLLYICLYNTTRNFGWHLVHQTELRDCPEIGQEDIYNNQTGFYTIKVVKGSAMNTITYCNFGLIQNEAYTLLYEIHDQVINGNSTTRAIVEIDDYGLSYSQILFIALPGFLIDFTDNPADAARYYYRGYTPHQMSLRFENTYYFGESCHNIVLRRGRSHYPCTLADNTWDYGSGVTGMSSDTIPTEKFIVHAFGSGCSDMVNIPQYCYRIFAINFLELAPPFPDVRLKGFADFESLTSMWEDNWWNLDFLIYATYPLPPGKYCTISSINNVQCFRNIYIYIY